MQFRFRVGRPGADSVPLLLGAMLVAGFGMLVGTGVLRADCGSGAADGAVGLPERPALADAAIFPSPLAVKDWASVVLARPVFDPGRSAREMAALMPILPRLAGTMIAPGEKIAILADAAGDLTVVRPGERVDGLTVVAISAAAVRLSGPSGIEALQIRDPAVPVPDIVTPLTMTADNVAGFPGMDLWPSQLQRSAQ